MQNSRVIVSQLFRRLPLKNRIQEFLEKYKSEGDAIIGHFGLGFYSSFMVASQVELVSLSARPEAQAVRWSCDGSPNFSLEAAERSEPGTDVILHLQEEELEYIEPSRIHTLISTYCDFMPVGQTACLRDGYWGVETSTTQMRKS